MPRSTKRSGAAPGRQSSPRSWDAGTASARNSSGNRRTATRLLGSSSFGSRSMSLAWSDCARVSSSFPAARAGSWTAMSSSDAKDAPHVESSGLANPDQNSPNPGSLSAIVTTRYTGTMSSKRSRTSSILARSRAEIFFRSASPDPSCGTLTAASTPSIGLRGRRRRTSSSTSSQTSRTSSASPVGAFTSTITASCEHQRSQTVGARSEGRL